MDAGLTDGDAVGRLRAILTVTGGAGQVPSRTVGIKDIEITAATAGGGAGLLIAEGGGDGGEIIRDRHLGDEKNGVRGVGERGNGGSREQRDENQDAFHHIEWILRRKLAHKCRWRSFFYWIMSG